MIFSSGIREVGWMILMESSGIIIIKLLWLLLKKMRTVNAEYFLHEFIS